MDPATLAALILALGIAVSILVSVPIAVGIGLSSLGAAAVLIGPEGAALAISQRMFAGINSFPLLAIPFFVLAGVLMNNGGIASRLIDAAMVLVGRLPASMAQTNIVANAMFGAVSGAAVAAAAAVGTVMTPRMEKEGYNKAFSAAVNVASAPAGMLIPPSNTFIVYSLVSSTSIAALFMAGVGPGLIWALACMAVALIWSRRNSNPETPVRPTAGQAALVLWRAVPSLLMMVIVIGGIIAGVFTATESSAIAVVYCLVLGFAYRAIKVADLPRIVLDASRTTAIVMLLVGVSSALSFVMSFARIPELVSEALLGLTTSPVAILVIMMAILLVVGTLHGPDAGHPHLRADLPADRHVLRHPPRALRHDDRLQPLCRRHHAARRQRPLRRGAGGRAADRAGRRQAGPLPRRARHRAVRRRVHPGHLDVAADPDGSDEPVTVRG
ncbi:TRAP transporter large permease [Intrasporangium sp. DVR]